MMMAALTYNLRKYMKFNRLKAIAKAAELPIRIEKHFQHFYACFIVSIIPLSHTQFYR
jgi:hypothetical protein